jgi:hypothetical protein
MSGACEGEGFDDLAEHDVLHVEWRSPELVAEWVQQPARFDVTGAEGYGRP